MQINLADPYRDTNLGREVETLLCPCVHCGQCTSTCPTFGLLDDEWDGPRGRSYLIKPLFEGTEPSIDALWPHIEAGTEAIVITASGCSAHFHDYGQLLHDDLRYRDKAQRASDMTRDIAEVVAAEWQDDTLPAVLPAQPPPRIAFQSPCSLQHGKKLNGVVESLLKRAGFKLVPARYPYMCCGSAGAYSILQPLLAQAQRGRKLDSLMASRPQAIATANIGCLTYLAQVSPVPVSHRIEMLDAMLPAGVSANAH